MEQALSRILVNTAHTSFTGYTRLDLVISGPSSILVASWILPLVCDGKFRDRSKDEYLHGNVNRLETALVRNKRVTVKSSTWGED